MSAAGAAAGWSKSRRDVDDRASRKLCSPLTNLMAHRPGGGLGAVVDAQLPENVGDVTFHGVHADPHSRGDVLVGPPSASSPSTTCSRRLSRCERSDPPDCSTAGGPHGPAIHRACRSSATALYFAASRSSPTRAARRPRCQAAEPQPTGTPWTRLRVAYGANVVRIVLARGTSPRATAVQPRMARLARNNESLRKRPKSLATSRRNPVNAACRRPVSASTRSASHRSVGNPGNRATSRLRWESDSSSRPDRQNSGTNCATS
jgi:hypothetical protein